MTILALEGVLPAGFARFSFLTLVTLWCKKANRTEKRQLSCDSFENKTGIDLHVCRLKR
jgi:hypothetical protein